MPENDITIDLFTPLEITDPKYPELEQVVSRFLEVNIFGRLKHQTTTRHGIMLVWDNTDLDHLLLSIRNYSKYSKYVGVSGGEFMYNIEYRAEGRLNGENTLLMAEIYGATPVMRRMDNHPYWFVTDPKTSS